MLRTCRLLLLKNAYSMGDETSGLRTLLRFRTRRWTFWRARRRRSARAGVVSAGCGSSCPSTSSGSSCRWGVVFSGRGEDAVAAPPIARVFLEYSESVALLPLERVGLKPACVWVSQVFLSVHFFLVAYNTDAIENNDFRTDAYTAECVFAGTWRTPSWAWISPWTVFMLLVYSQESLVVLKGVSTR